MRGECVLDNVFLYLVWDLGKRSEVGIVFMFLLCVGKDFWFVENRYFNVFV